MRGESRAPSEDVNENVDEGAAGGDEADAVDRACPKTGKYW
jgi:hypothetical protein